MRSGIWRGAATACALLGAWGASASADLFHHTIPELTPALDYRTGDQYYAPPIPYGHYVGKDIPGHVLGAASGATGLARGAIYGPIGHVKGLFGGLFHRHGHCGHCQDLGCSGHYAGGDPGYGPASCQPIVGDAPTLGGPAPYSGPTIGGPEIGAPSPVQGQFLPGPAPMIQSESLGEPSASLDRPLPEAGTIRDPALQRTGLDDDGIPAAGGMPYGHQEVGPGGPPQFSGPVGGDCGAAGPGCGHGGACHHGGGLGSRLLGYPHALLGKVYGLPHTVLGAAHGAIGTAFHRGDIDYFVGPGGPVPLTPGYVPYVISTRSPRDYFAFPPYTTLNP
jgi:hypothetical protein